VASHAALRREPCWHAGWLDKLKEDQRAIGATLAVIVSTALLIIKGEHLHPKRSFRLCEHASL
jgi:hypothetical protein